MEGEIREAGPGAGGAVGGLLTGGEQVGAGFVEGGHGWWSGWRGFWAGSERVIGDGDGKEGEGCW